MLHIQKSVIPIIILICFWMDCWMELSRLCWDSWSRKSIKSRPSVSCTQTTVKGAKSSLELGPNTRSEPFMKQAARWASPLFHPPPSSVNDSYSACAVVYSFPAVKGCPLKVPFVHRLHFVIQIAPLFFFEMAGGSRSPLSAARRQNVVAAQRSEKTSSSAFEMNPLHCTSPISSLPFQSRIYIYSIYIHIYMCIYIVQKETGVN